ncbi:unnamed protein product [Leptosia nina]|uniref:RNase H type-1 domain-containing protein n=1 Tax=Leptosia nina TaxID=320188 RepID=A0AAV1JCV9_9NEOP
MFVVPRENRSPPPPANLINLDKTFEVESGASRDLETNYTTLNLTTRARAEVTKIRRAVTESRNLRSDLKQKILESTDELNIILKNIKESAVGNKQSLPSPTLPTRRLDPENAPTSTTIPPTTIEHKILEHLKENKELIKQQTEELNKLKKEIKTNKQEIKHDESGKTIIEELNNMNKKLSEIDQKIININFTSLEELNLDTIKEETRNINKLQEIMKEQIKILKEESNNMKSDNNLEELKTFIDKKLTYANIAARPKETKISDFKEKETEVHSIIVSPINEKETGEEVIKRIRSAVNAKEEGIQIERIRKVKDGKTQNKNVTNSIAEEDFRVKEKYRRRARNSHEEHVVLQVSPKLWSALTAVGKVHIDMQKVNVEDQSPVIQCTGCLGFGHGRRNCESKESEICSHCGGQHLKAECERYSGGYPPKCHNCASSNLQSIDHGAFDINCPIRSRWEKIARQNKRTIIGGDANAKSVWWGSDKTNQRGELLEELLEESNMNILNEGNTPTFETIRGNTLYSSIVDITACTPEMMNLISNWEVNKGIVNSDHNAITFKIKLEEQRGLYIINNTRKYKTKGAEWTKFSNELKEKLKDNNLNIEHLETITNKNNLEKTLENYIKMVTEVCDTQLPKIKRETKINIPWWNETLTNMKKDVARLKRRIKFARPTRKLHVVEEYLKKKEEYENETEKARTESWKGFCGKQTKEGLWDGIYKIISKSSKRGEDQQLEKEGKLLTTQESAQWLAETFYPRDTQEKENEEQKEIRREAEIINRVEENEKEDPEITIDELISVTNSFNPKKAPGKDGLTADICKEAIKTDPTLFLKIVNKCLELGYFPTQWKEATIIVIRKPGKDNYKVPKSYRPIGLLPVMGKILEKIIIKRINWHIIPKLREKIRRNTNKGCVQGSVGGPVLWNVVIDTLLQTLEEEGCESQAFADDVVLLFEGENANEIENQANRILKIINSWGNLNKLTFAAHKTKAIVFTNKLKYRDPDIIFNNTKIKLEKEIKILGLTIDRKLTFENHVNNIIKKTTKLHNYVSKAAKVNWGLNPEIIKTIYTAVLEPIILYASPAWGDAANKLSIINKLKQIQRKFAIKIIKAYKTVSYEASLTIAGLLPLDLKIKELVKLYKIKKGIENDYKELEPETKVDFKTKPHPAKEIRLKFRAVTTEKELDKIEGIRIFTDGSKIEGKVGAAYVVIKNGKEITNKKLKLGNQCSVYQAELLAIIKALEALSHGTWEEEINILSDSLSSIKAITELNSNHQLVFQIKNKIRELQDQNIVVKLNWIKAHVGLIGNERADELAKEAALKLKTKPNYEKCPISTLKRIIREESVEEWCDRYSTSQNGSVTKLFFPSPKVAFHHNKVNTHHQLNTQILTGHGAFSNYLHKYKCKNDPTCECDGITPETVIHCLMECPIHQIERWNLQQITNIDIKSENLEDLILLRPEEFFRFARKIIKKLITRNKS